MRIATWNLERCNPRKREAQLSRIGEIDADIWLLTETTTDFQPTPLHAHSALSPAHPERRPEHERWAAIWSKWPLKQIGDPVAHRRGSVSAVVDTPDGEIILYCTVIAWHGEKRFDDGTPAKGWEVHHREAERQASEWRRIRELYPELPLVIGGDFNQVRDGRGRYGTDRSRQIITDALDATGLSCVTEFDARAEGFVHDKSLVDHICVPRGWEPLEATVVDRFDEDGKALSDHPIVIVEICFKD